MVVLNYLLVIDNGGTNIKSVLFDTNGKQIEKVSFPTPLLEASSKYKEVNLDQQWESISNSIKELINKSKINPKNIIGVSSVGHGKGLYLLDSQGKPVRNGILSADNRAVDIAKQFQEKQKDSLIEIQTIINSQAPILLNWLKKYETHNYERIEHYLSAKDYIRFKLTGDASTDYTDASSNNLLNINEKKYDENIYSFFEIEELYSKRPSIVNSEEICGYVTKEASAETGIPEGTPVAGGMFDIDASALSTGVLSEEYISVTAGTWSINEYLSTKPVKENENILNSIFVDPKFYLVESSSPTSAGNLDYIANVLNDDEADIYSQLNNVIKNTSPDTTDIIFIPFLYGSNVNPLARGSFIGLDTSISKETLIRSIYEGIVFSHKYHIEKLLETKVTPTKSIRLAGGVVNSKEWVQIFADILEFPIDIVEGNELGALGGAIALSVGLNIHSTFSEASKKMTKIKETLYPNEENIAIYRKKYKQYKKILTALDDIW